MTDRNAWGSLGLLCADVSRGDEPRGAVGLTPPKPPVWGDLLEGVGLLTEGAVTALPPESDSVWREWARGFICL